DPRAARLAGVNRRGLLFAVYIASGVLSAVAGVFATARVVTVDVSNAGYQLEADAILAVAIGRTSLAAGRCYLSGAAGGARVLATRDKPVLVRGISSSATPAFRAFGTIGLWLLQAERVRARARARRSAAAPTPSGSPKGAVAA